MVNIFGNNLDVLDRKAQEVARVLGKVPGAADVQLQSPPGAPQLVIHLREQDLIRWGFDPVHVLNSIRTAYQGDIVSQIYVGNRVFGVSVVLDPEPRKKITEVGRPAFTQSAREPTSPFGSLADIYQTSGRFVVLHKGRKGCKPSPAMWWGDLTDASVADAKKQVAAVSLSPGTYVEFTGTAEAQARSRRDL